MGLVWPGGLGAAAGLPAKATPSMALWALWYVPGIVRGTVRGKGWGRVGKAGGSLSFITFSADATYMYNCTLRNDMLHTERPET